MIDAGIIKSCKVGSIPFYAVKQSDDGPYHSLTGIAYTPFGMVEVNSYWEDDRTGYEQMLMEMILDGRRYRASVRGHFPPKSITKHAREFARQCYLLSQPADTSTAA